MRKKPPRRATPRRWPTCARRSIRPRPRRSASIETSPTLEAKGYDLTTAYARDYIAKQVEIATGAETIRQAQDDWNASLGATAELFDTIDQTVQRAAEGMADAFGSVGRAIGDVASIMSGYYAQQAHLQQEHEAAIRAAHGDETRIARENQLFAMRSSSAQIGMYGDMLGAAKGFFKEGSAGYKALAAAEKVYRIAQLAMSLQAMIQNTLETTTHVANAAAQATADGAAGVAAQAKLPFPANIAAMAATAAALVAAGVAVFGGGGGSHSAPKTNTGTGTVLGDANAKSESVKRAIDQLREVDTTTSVFARQMAGSLRSIDDQISGFAAQIVRSGDVGAGAGVADGFKTNAVGSLLSKVPLVGNLLGGLFGTKTSVIGSGLYGSAQSIGSILTGGFDAQTYADVEKKKKLFGITTSTKTSTQYAAADAGLENQFTLILKSFASAIAGAAVPLGEATSDVEARLNGFVVSIGKIDLKGLTGTEIQEKLEAVFGAAADGMAEAAFPGITRFQKAGEGAFETLVRVVTDAGVSIELGTTAAAPTIGIVDYSRRETDAFGVTTIVERGFARRMSVKLGVPFDGVDALQRQLADLRATPALWVADERFASLAFRGLYKSFEVDLATPALSYCTLTVEGVAAAEPFVDAGDDPAPTGLTSTLQLLQPLDVVDVGLTSSVDEADAPEWVANASYAKGARVIRAAMHRVYESLVAANAGADPATSPANWLDVGPTNRWAMFDQALGTSTSAIGAIVVTIDVGVVDAIALLDVVASTIRVRAAGYDRTIAVGAGAVTFLDLAGATGPVNVKVLGTGPVSVGTLLLGRLAYLGATEVSPTAGITDYSRVDIDDFGGVTVVQRSFAKRMTARALFRTDLLDQVAGRIAAVRARPSLWIGQAGLDSLTVYGFFKDFEIEVGETLSKLSLSIEGLSTAARPAPLGSIVAWPDIADPAGTKPDDGADVTGAHTSRDTNAVGGQPAAVVLDGIQDNTFGRALAAAEGELARLRTRALSFPGPNGEDSYTLLRRETFERKTADGVFAETFDLLGARTAGGTAFVLNTSTVLVEGDETLAQRFAAISTTLGDQRGAIEHIDQVLIGPEGAAARALVKVDVNGRIIGTALTNDGTEGGFIVSADKVRFEDPVTGEAFLYADAARQLLIAHNVEVDTLKVGAVGYDAMKLGAAQKAAFYVLPATVNVPKTVTVEVCSLSFTKEDTDSILEILVQMKCASDDDFQFDATIQVDGMVMDTTQVNLVLVRNNARLPITPFTYVRTGATAGVYSYSGSAWVIDTAFAASLSAIVKPLVDQAKAAAALIPITYPGTFTAQRIGVDNGGQSLGAGPVSNIGLTKSAYLNSVGFPWRAVSPTAFVPLDVPHTQAHFPTDADNRGECPLYGAVRQFKQLIANSTLPTSGSPDVQVVGTNNAVDGQALDYFIKGTPNYAAKMSQIQAAWDLSQGPNVPLADRRTYEFLATFHTQGEAGSSGNYRDTLLQYARDLNTDAKAITKQLLDAILICYQTPTNQTSALGQYQASQLSSLVVMATPIYQLWFEDALHLDANSEQILGAYYGLVLWWTQILRRKWHTCSPTGRIIRISDRIYDVEYHAAGRLVFDTVNMPPQANNGFYLIGTGDQVLPSTAALKEGTTNVVRVTAADPIPANSLHQYGRTTIVGKPNVQGFGGNLRDCLGDIFTFDVMDDLGNIRIADHPLHRWSPLHSIAIPPLA